MKNGRALVTGATGHLGSTLCAALEAMGVEVTALVRPTSCRAALAGTAVRTAVGNVLDEAAFARAAEGCDVVFHNAAVFEIHASDADAMRHVAVQGARNAVAVAARVGARLVYTSSVAAVGFGAGPGDLLDEDAWAEDLTVPYYRAKQESERAVVAAAQEKGVEVVRVLPTLVLGPGDHRITPSSRLLLDLLSGEGVTFDGGANVIDVRDVASAMIAAAERGRPGARYILGGENVLVRDLGAVVARQTGRRLRHVALPRWAMAAVAGAMELGAAVTGRAPALTRAVVRDVFGRYAWYDTRRARTELGLVTRPMAETIADAARFFREAA